MAKSKHAPALFELIDSAPRKEKSKLAVPKWFQGRRGARAAEASGATDSGSAGKPTAPTAPKQPEPGLFDVGNPAPPVEVQPPDMAESPAEARGTPARMPAISEWPAAEAAKPSRRLRLAGLTLKLNPVNVGVATAIVMVVAILVFQVGRGLSGGAAVDPAIDGATGVVEIDQAMLQSPNPGVLEPDSDGAGSPQLPSTAGINIPATGGGGTSERRASNYVVIESFEPGDREDVEHAQKWLQEAKGIPTTIRKSGQRWLLVSAQGFDYRQPGEKQQAIDFCEAAKVWGKEYKQAFAGKREIRYLFLSPGVRKFTD